MKTWLKILAAAAAVILLLIGGFMAAVSFLHAKASRDVTQLVSEIRPGTAFSSIASKLGGEPLTYTRAVEIESYGTTKEPTIVTNSALHVFAHDARSWSYRICIYTDTNSEAVLYASWKEQ